MPSLYPQAQALVDAIMLVAKREPGVDPGTDYRATATLLAECIGYRTVSPRWVFWRCRGCLNLRCTREVSQFPFCLCGSRTLEPYEGEMTTRLAAKVLRRAERRERVEARTSWTP